MLTSTTKAKLSRLLPDLRFPPEEERSFQKDYFDRIHSRLRSHIWLLSILNCFLLFLECMSDDLLGPGNKPELDGYGLLALVGVATISLSLLWLSIRRVLEGIWQRWLVLATLAPVAAAFLTHNDYYFILCVFHLPIIAFRLQPLQFRWTLVQVLATIVIVAGPAINVLRGMSPYSPRWTSLLLILLIFLGALLTALIYSYKNESAEREEYRRKTQLAQERDQERDKREQTERMLHILSQAIGGIVHDLGNPLTAVQGGADTLLEFAKEDEPNEELIQEFAEMITDGAQMLNYLRLSLMEQTRVLEGKPIPIEQKPTSMRHIVEAGTYYQKPKFAAGRHIVLQGDEMEVCVDEMRFITVFMNLIGNALKYSDGTVRVIWHSRHDRVFIAVMDQGLRGQGITRAQAQKLFVPFGRLDTHSQIEGTGLGLLSVQKIAEAHGGEIYIEGHVEGTGGSALFSTSQNNYRSVLEDGFLTAFVAACPFKVLAHNEPVEQTYTTGAEQTSLR